PPAGPAAARAVGGADRQRRRQRGHLERRPQPLRQRRLRLDHPGQRHHADRPPLPPPPRLRPYNYRCPVSLKLTSIGGRSESHCTMVIAQFAWLSPIQRHTGASSTWRTNQPITKLCVISRSCRSSSPVTPKR